jgi:hypothetical protein
MSLCVQFIHFIQRRHKKWKLIFHNNPPPRIHILHIPLIPPLTEYGLHQIIPSNGERQNTWLISECPKSYLLCQNGSPTGQLTSYPAKTIITVRDRILLNRQVVTYDPSTDVHWCKHDGENDDERFHPSWTREEVCSNHFPATESSKVIVSVWSHSLLSKLAKTRISSCFSISNCLYDIHISLITLHP